MKKIILFFCFIVIAYVGFSQTPSPQSYLDTTFNSTSATPGQVSFSTLIGQTSAMTVDSKGIIYLVTSDTTSKTIRLNVLNPDGSFNINFNKTGISSAVVTKGIFLTSMALDTDGSIYLGGYKLIASGNNDMILIKLKPDGSLDTNFGTSGYWIHDFGGYDEVDKFYIRSNDIIVTGIGNYKLVFARLSKAGSFDPLFASGTGYKQFTYINRVGKIAISSNSLYIGGDSSGISKIIKFSFDGNLDGSFGKGGIASLGSGYADNVFGFEFQPDGKIVMGGSTSYYSFKVARLNADGSLDKTFAGSGDTTYGSSIGYFSGGNFHRLDNGSILLTAYYYSSSMEIFKLNSSGYPVKPFGSNGQLLISNYPANMRSYLTSDQRLLMFSFDNSKQYFLRKFFTQPTFHIVGSNFVAPKSVQNYTVSVPSTWAGATYTWSYSSTNASFVSSTTGSKVSLYITDTATAGGLLTCNAMSPAGAPLGYQELQIKINTSPSASNQLGQLQCKPGATDAAVNYIYYLGLNSLKNFSSYNDYGYWDYTQSTTTDTIIVGSAYSASVQLTNSEGKVAYVALWIDYNNDGAFTASELVGQAAGTSSLIEVKNLVVQNMPGNDGAKRLRIRCRLDSAFTGSDACAKRGETGETEDYLVVLRAQQGLSAPEIITPNEDGKNDFFVIRGIDPTKSNKLTVFDRLGEVRFSASNYSNNWNGIDKEGRKLDPGTYYFVFTNDNDLIRGFLEVRY
jgi:uncharacterized delta-60 repeat protein/gliding motility-associated-like protein